MIEQAKYLNVSCVGFEAIRVQSTYLDLVFVLESDVNFCPCCGSRRVRKTVLGDFYCERCGVFQRLYSFSQEDNDGI